MELSETWSAGSTFQTNWSNVKNLAVMSWRSLRHIDFSFFYQRWSALKYTKTYKTLYLVIFLSYWTGKQSQNYLTKVNTIFFKNGHSFQQIYLYYLISKFFRARRFPFFQIYSQISSVVLADFRLRLAYNLPLCVLSTSQKIHCIYGNMWCFARFGSICTI